MRRYGRRPIFGLFGAFLSRIVLVLFLLSASQACVSAEKVRPRWAIGDPRAVVARYYQEVLEGKDPDGAFLAEIVETGVLVEPIGWTASGKPFYDVIGGRLERETVTVEVPPVPQAPGPIRSGRIMVEKIVIFQTDWPEYYATIGEMRSGFASTRNDSIFLDARLTDSSALLEESFEHELMHIIDRPLFGRVPAEDLEIRAMLRGLVEGNVVEEERKRLETAASGEGRYARAAHRILAAMGEVLKGDPKADLRSIPDAEWKRAGRILAVLAGVPLRRSR
ncbi:MAG: hypothetical protein D6679_03035 [Candidatus Hydrogenedentota bacterium]|nr:MAG: hypothetical protein D6679_03035 [Candidatus Hydrogenedentota bacterium]